MVSSAPWVACETLPIAAPYPSRLTRSAWLTTSTKRKPSLSALTRTTSPRPTSTPLTRTSRGAPGPRSSSTIEPRPILTHIADRDLGTPEFDRQTDRHIEDEIEPACRR